MTVPVVGLVGKLKVVATAMLQQALADWGQMTGMLTEIADAKVQNLSRGAPLETTVAGPVMLVETRVEGRCEGPFYFVFPMSLAAHAVGKFVMLAPAVIQAKASSGLDATDIEAFKELANLMCGSSNNVLAKMQPGLRLSQSVDHLKVRSAMPDVRACSSELPNTDLACVASTAKVDGQAFTTFQLLPLTLARAMLT